MNGQPITSYIYVEDNDDLRESISELIERPDRKIATFASAEALLAATDYSNYQVLITDVSLPGMSGTDLVRHWLKSDLTRWVVLCSGYEFSHGLDIFGPNVRSLPKAFELEELEALLCEIEAAIHQEKV